MVSVGSMWVNADKRTVLVRNNYACGDEGIANIAFCDIKIDKDGSKHADFACEYLSESEFLLEFVELDDSCQASVPTEEESAISIAVSLASIAKSLSKIADLMKESNRMRERQYRGSGNRG